VVELVDDHHVEPLSGSSCSIPARSATGSRRTRAATRGAGRRRAARRRTPSCRTSRKVRRLCSSSSLRWATNSSDRPAQLIGAGPPAGGSRGRRRPSCPSRSARRRGCATGRGGALDLERLEDLLLVGPRPDLEPGGDREPAVVAAGALGGDGRIEPPAVAIAVGLELRVGPVGLEGRGDLLDHRWGVGLGQPNVPLEPVEQRRTRQVRRSDERGRVAAVTVQSSQALACSRVERVS
jgi:hypothetical protein